VSEERSAYNMHQKVRRRGVLPYLPPPLFSSLSYEDVQLKYIFYINKRRYLEPRHKQAASKEF
jgi:hypothetical protein